MFSKTVWRFNLFAVLGMRGRMHRKVKQQQSSFQGRGWYFEGIWKGPPGRGLCSDKGYCPYPGLLRCSGLSWSQSSGLLPPPGRQAAHWAKGYTAFQFFSHWLPQVHGCQWPNSPGPKGTVQFSWPASECTSGVRSTVRKLTLAGYSPWKFPPEIVSPRLAKTIFQNRLRLTQNIVGHFKGDSYPHLLMFSIEVAGQSLYR